MIDRLEAIAKRYREIDSEMARPDVATDHEKLTRLAREQRSMREIVAAYEAFRRARGEMESARELVRHEKDSEMQEYLRSEERRAAEQVAELEERLKVLLLPKDPNDERDVVVELKPEDLEIKASTSTGPGGQSVNTTYSAIRITHKPTGLVVSIQDEKSQLQNREKALRVLRARLYEMKLAEQQEAIGAQRRGMGRTGNRSEELRTYNFKQNRVTDHRINLTLHKLDQVLNGDLDELVSALAGAERAAQLNGGGDQSAT